MPAAVWTLLFLATIQGTRALPVIAPSGVSLPPRIEIEWLAGDSTSLGVETLPLTDHSLLPGAPPHDAQFLRAVGPNVVSVSVPLTKLDAGLRLAPAGRLRLTDLPPSASKARVVMRLAGSDLEYEREISTAGAPEVEFAVPVGTYSAAVDVGPRQAPTIMPAVVIGIGAVSRLAIHDSPARPLNLRVVAKDDDQPLAGASVSGTPTAELLPVFWRLLAARCGVTGSSGVLSCGMVPLTLRGVDVSAPRRRRTHVAVPAPAPDADPKRPLRAALAQYQNVVVTTSVASEFPPRIVNHLTAVLTRCERPPCDESKAARSELASRRRVTFPRLEPGRYRVWLESQAARSSAISVVTSDDSAAPDDVVADLSLDVWHFVGSTRLADGVGTAAKIWFAALPENSNQEELAQIVNSDASGAYDTFLMAPVGAIITAEALSDRPPAEGEVTPPGIKLAGGNHRIPLDIELSTSGGIVKLLDKNTREPIRDCSVAFFHWAPNSGGIRVLKSDADGIVRWLGISKGTFLARATCNGYRPASTEKSELAGGADETVLELEASGDVRLRVRDADGNPLPGALVFLEQSAYENVSFPFQIPAEQLGTTDFDGEISVPLRPHPGYYVVAPHHALHVARLAPCIVTAGCVEEVQLARPIAFPGIRVRTAEGEPASAAWLVFSKDGVAIPVSIQNELVKANQIDAGQQLIVREGSDTVHMLPALFEAGIYDVEYAKTRPGAPPQRIPLGRVAIPSTHRFELILPPAPRAN